MTCKFAGCVRSMRFSTAGYCCMHYQRQRFGKPMDGPQRTRRGQESPSTKEATLSPTTRDLAWAAGFIEGEGSFTKHATSMTVSAVQVNKEPAERLLMLFGGSLKHYTYQNRNPPRAVWRWSASGARGRGIAMTLYTFMSTKRQGQIRAAL